MANKIKQTTSGACANFKACNLLRSDVHNLRTGRITNPNIDLSLTHLNISWVAPEISDLRAYDRQIRADYVSFPRQRRQNGKEIIYHRPLPKKGRTKASPIMELILLLPDAAQAKGLCLRLILFRELFADMWLMHPMHSCLHRLTTVTL